MHIDLTYHYLVRHVCPGPQSISYFVTLLLLPFALLLPRPILSRWLSILLFMPVMIIATFHAWKIMGGLDVISIDVLLWAIYLLVLKDPWKDFRRIGEGQRHRTKDTARTESRFHYARQTEDEILSANKADNGNNTLRAPQNSNSHEQSYPASLAERIPWILTLLASIRLDNWKIGRPSHDRQQPPSAASRSRKSFVMKTLISSIRGFLVLDLTRAYVSYDPYFTDTSVSISSPLPFSSPSLIPPRFLRAAIVGAQAWACISELFYLPCLLPVGLNALGLLADDWSPHNWSPYFGPPSVVLLRGMRGFWSQYWHQSMRSFASEPGYAIADLVRLKRDSLIRYAIITTIAFGLSGCIHTGLVPPEPLHALVDANTIRFHIAGFFWVQPIAMLVEVLGARLLSRRVSKDYWEHGVGLKARMTANGIYFLTWFTWCLPLLGEAARQLGYWRVWPLPVSLWRGLRGEGWITWPFLTEELSQR